MSDKEAPADPHAMMRDWMTLWQSEIAAMGVDRELQEGWTRMAEAWISAQGAHDPAARPGADAAARSKTAAAAPDAEPRGGREFAALRAELDGLRRRIEQLEERSGQRRRAAKA